MLVLEYKLDAAPAQYARMDEAIRSAQFVRNRCLRLWMGPLARSQRWEQVKSDGRTKHLPAEAG
jgi:hypothetical protein